MNDITTLFSVEQSEMKAGLALVKRTLSKRSTLPVLSHVKIEASEDNGRITMTTSNLETTTMVDIYGQVSQGGGLTVRGDTLTELINALPDGPLTFRCTKTSMNIQGSGAKSKLNLKGFDLVEFPLINPLPESANIEIEAGTLGSLLGAGGVAVSKDDPNRMMSGTHLSAEGGKIVAQSTNGSWLSQAHTEIESMTSAHVLLPPNTVSELTRWAKSDPDEVIIMRLGESKAIFDFGWGQIHTSLIEAPTLENPFAPECEHKATISVSDLVSSLRMVKAYAQEGTGRVIVEWEPQKELGKVIVSAVSAAIGTGAAEVGAISTGSLRVGYNISYLLALLANAQETVTIQGDSHNSINTITTEPDKNGVYAQFWIAPMLSV